MPQGMRRMSGDRASLVWRLSGDAQRSAIEAVGEEEAGPGMRQRLWDGPSGSFAGEGVSTAMPLWAQIRSAYILAWPGSVTWLDGRWMSSRGAAKLMLRGLWIEHEARMAGGDVGSQYSAEWHQRELR
ncbi:MAG: hypothetical protein MMC33_006499 [Icmadophila ericetorum]|nr:hypothetical protein [Icmadophila ericetorum]